MAGITVTVDDHEIRKALKRLAAVTGDLKPVFRDIGEALLLSTRERFEQEKDPDGKAWHELSPAYLAEKPYNQDKILVLDGHLMDSIHCAAYEKLLTLGTNDIKAATHQLGRGNIPARPFMGLSADDEQASLNEIEKHIRLALQ